MPDVHTKKQRSYNMSQIRSRDTKPEIRLRRLIYSQGIRGYRIAAKLPGKPDLVFTKYKIAVFVDGCFWHKCSECFHEPQTNREFWLKKIGDNVIRDRKVTDKLKNDGWTVLRFWEHELKKDINSCCRTILEELKKRGYPDDC